MFTDKMGPIKDSVKMSIRNKTPEEMADSPENRERKMRMAHIPQQWYVLAGGSLEIKPCEWMEYFRTGSWIRVVYDSDVAIYNVFMGRIRGLCGEDSVQIEPHTALFDNKVHDNWLDHSTLKIDGEGAVQVFTDDKFMADKVKENRG